MTLLLDTHVLLWWLSGSAKLGSKARALIGDPESTIWISAASAWEIAIKAGLGRLELDEPAETCLPREMERNGFRALPITVKHALAVKVLPALHADPFDRLLIAQADLEGVALVTADAMIRRYDVRTIDARV